MVTEPKENKRSPEAAVGQEQEITGQDLEPLEDAPDADGEESGQALPEEDHDPVDEEEKGDLQFTLNETQEKAQEYLEGWQRSRAEFANYKKRIMKEKESIHQYARGEVIKDFLDIADDLGRALQDRPEDGRGADWAEGIEIIYKKLLSKLEAEGVKRMESRGEPFDPNIHEAIMQEEHEEFESGQIIEVIQDGYFLGDRVLRPALVRVAA